MDAHIGEMRAVGAVPHFSHSLILSKLKAGFQIGSGTMLWCGSEPNIEGLNRRFYCLIFVIFSHILLLLLIIIKHFSMPQSPFLAEKDIDKWY